MIFWFLRKTEEEKFQQALKENEASRQKLIDECRKMEQHCARVAIDAKIGSQKIQESAAYVGYATPQTSSGEQRPSCF